jgi:uncharacterized protein (DUF1684 family)
MGQAAARLSLLDWKRTVFDTYRQARSAPEPAAGWARWRAVRDELFAHHEQSPLRPEARAGFRGLPYYPYDPTARTLAAVEDVEPQTLQIGASGGEGETVRFTRFARARFPLGGEEHELSLFWLEAYGGGIFLPFADATRGRETYGAGRYLLDTVKGADLGVEGGQLVLDFNFAFNPSCSYDDSWVCPLAPPENRLRVRVEAGERVR